MHCTAHVLNDVNMGEGWPNPQVNMFEKVNRKKCRLELVNGNKLWQKTIQRNEKLVEMKAVQKRINPKRISCLNRLANYVSDTTIHSTSI